MRPLNRAAAIAAAMLAAACAAQIKSSPDDKLAARAAAFARDYNAQLCVISSKCEVVVKVLANCDIRPDPHTIGIPEGFSNVDITWTISTDSHGKVEFTRDGIAFKTPGASREFENPRPTGNQFKWKDKNPHDAGNPKREFHYTIKVMQDGQACRLDPTVVNDY